MGQTKQRYKPVKGDIIDEKWAEYLNNANLKLPVVREKEGVYIFGTKKVTAKILNENLMIRVGGGYMGAADFISQHGA